MDRNVDIRISVGERFLSVTLGPDTVRPGETFVLAWSVLPMSEAELEQTVDELPIVGVARDGLRTSVEFDVASGPVGPCEPVDAITP